MASKKAKAKRPGERSGDQAPRQYERTALSQYEGFKRLDKSLEKLELGDKAKEKVCDVCGRRVRAWRIVPSSAGQRLGLTKAMLKSGGLTGRFLVCCDANDMGCAAILDRSGVPADAIVEEAAAARLGIVLP